MFQLCIVTSNSLATMPKTRSIPSDFFYGPYRTKPDYDRAFGEAREWALREGAKDPHPSSTAARIYHVKEPALRQSVLRAKKKTERNAQGLYNQHGGHNKILNPAQEEAIRQYCYEQWEAGLGATPRMVKAAIDHLRQVGYYRISIRICCLLR